MSISKAVKNYFFLYFLLIPVFAFSQGSAHLYQLPERIEDQEQLNQQQFDPKDSLPDDLTLQDSLSFQVALDSLKQMNLSPKEFAEKADSLRKTFISKIDKQNLALNKVKSLSSSSEVNSAVSPYLQLKKVNDNFPPAASQNLPNASASSKLPGNPIGTVNSQHPYSALLNQLPDPNVAKGLAKQYSLAAAKTAAIKKLPNHQKELKEAQRVLTQYKKRLGQTMALKDSSKTFIKSGSLRNTSWSDRVLIGTLWEFNKQEQYFFELGPNLAWRFNKRISAGGGFQYRLSVISKSPWVASSDKVYGFYTFSDFKIKNGFFGRLHYESLHTEILRPDPQTQSDILAKEWVGGLSLGFGKSFGFFRSLNGFALMHYNILYQSDKTPYLRPLQVKIGFYIVGSHPKGLKK